MTESRESRNKTLVRQFVEAMNAHDVPAAASLVAEDFVNHAAVPQAQGRSGYEMMAGKLLRGFPDMHLEIEQLIAEGDTVVCVGTMTGTQTGPLDFVRWPVPATGKAVRALHIHVYRIKDDVLVEHWAAYDSMRMLAQLGVLQPADQGPRSAAGGAA